MTIEALIDLSEQFPLVEVDLDHLNRTYKVSGRVFRNIDEAAKHILKLASIKLFS